MLVIAAAAVLITWAFDADVDAQSGAYATGVLVLMTSASLAVTLSAVRRHRRSAAVAFTVITAAFTYTTIDNITERPDGVKIATLFIAAIILVSLISRIGRSFELRTGSITLTTQAASFLIGQAGREVQIIAHEPDQTNRDALGGKEHQQRTDNHIPAKDPVIFLEVTLSDASDFSADLTVRGSIRHGRRVLEMTAPVIPNSIAALLIHIRDTYQVKPNIYFEWTEGGPVANLLRFLFLGVGEIAPTTREVLRRAEPDRSRRPKVHVG